MSIKKDKRQQNTILRVSAYLFRYKGLFWLTIGLAASVAAMEIAVPIAIQRIFDGLKATRALDGLIYGVGLIALFYLGSEIFNSLRIGTRYWRYPEDLNDQYLSFLSATLPGILRISASSNLANYGYLLLEGISRNLERGARELGRS